MKTQMAIKYFGKGSLEYLLGLIKGKLDGKADKATTLSGYGITDGLSTSTKYAGSSSVGGAASSANKLATGRTIALGTGVTGTATSFNGESNITIPVTAVKEAYLSWGGKNLSGSVSPIGMSLSNEHSANRMAFINGAAITCEYSSDNGRSWSDYGYNNLNKSELFTKSYSIPIGRAVWSENYTTESKTRITITAQNGTSSYVYCNPKKMLINVTTSGGMQLLVETRTGKKYNTDGEWSTFGIYELSGWSGWNDIPLILSTLGGYSEQTDNNWQLRLTFSMTYVNKDYPTTAFLYKIRIYSDNAWESTGTMGSTGHLYSFDMNENATFPAAIKASSDIYEGGTAEANKLSNRYSPKAGSSSLTTCSKGTFNNAATYDVESTVANDSKLPTGAAVKAFVEGKGYTAVTETTVSGWGFTKNAGTVVGAKVGTDDVVSTNGTLWFPAYPTTLPASDVSSWAKASTRPSYSLDTTSGNATTGISASTTALSGTTSVLTSVKSAGSAPTLGTAIPADDITAWSTNVPSSFSVADGVLTLTVGSAALLSYTAKSIPNVTAVGSMPTFNSGNVASTSHTHTITVTDSGHTHSVESTLS